MYPTTLPAPYSCPAYPADRGRQPSRHRLDAFYCMQSNTAPYKTHYRHVSAILPAYLTQPGDADTNGTVILYQDGRAEQVPHTLRYVLDDWLGYQQSSIDTLRSQSCQYLGDTACRRVPLLLGDSLCLLPVKVRKAHNRNHSVTGYIVLNKLKRVHTRHTCPHSQRVLGVSDPGTYTANAAVIHLSDNTYLQTMECKQTIEHNMSLAIGLVHQYCTERQLDPRPFLCDKYLPASQDAPGEPPNTKII